MVTPTWKKGYFKLTGKIRLKILDKLKTSFNLSQRCSMILNKILIQ